MVAREAVRKAINELVKNTRKAFGWRSRYSPHLPISMAYDRRLLAEAGVNMFSWIIDWLELSYTEDHDDEIDLNDIETNKQLMLHNLYPPSADAVLWCL